MSGAPQRLHRLVGAVHGIGQALRAGTHTGALVPHLLPRFAVSQKARNTNLQQQHQPRSASGARHQPASHRMTKRVFFIAVKGPLRRCAPLTELAPRRHNPPLAAKQKSLAFAHVREPESSLGKIC
jgi:hypothetical protein